MHEGKKQTFCVEHSRWWTSKGRIKVARFFQKKHPKSSSLQRKRYYTYLSGMYLLSLLCWIALTCSQVHGHPTYPEALKIMKILTEAEALQWTEDNRRRPLINYNTSFFYWKLIWGLFFFFNNSLATITKINFRTFWTFTVT